MSVKKVSKELELREAGIHPLLIYSEKKKQIAIADFSYFSYSDNQLFMLYMCH